MRAILTNAQSGKKQGASTITQQVAKNFLLSNEQTYDRKIKEALIALRIESTYSKDKILELYLNEIFLGTIVPAATSTASPRPRSITSASRSTS